MDEVSFDTNAYLSYTTPLALSLVSKEGEL